MIGLIILLVAGIYLAAWIAVVFFSYRATLRQTQSKKKAFTVSSVLFVIMYMIPFWDLIPTLLVHKYHCDTEAGFTVYKDPEKWKRENPDVFLSLEPFQHHAPIETSTGSGTQMNDIFGTIFRKEDISFFPVQKKQWQLVDVVTKEVIAEDVDFGRGFGKFSIGHKGALKFWLYETSCFSEQERAHRSKKTMGKLFDEFKMTRRVR